MKPVRALSFLLAGSFLLASQAPRAAQCFHGPSSFTDVATSDTFCTNTEWLRNRVVTQGCTATEYCPAQPVTRAQMALFMNRLADAIVPEPMLVSETISNRTVTVNPLDNQFCLINVPGAAHPRAFSITGSVSITGPSQAGGLSAAVRTEDGGGIGLNTYEQVDVTITSGVELHLPIVMLFKPDPGPRTFRMTLHAGSPILVAIAKCTLRVEARSVTGTLPPY